MNTKDYLEGYKEKLIKRGNELLEDTIPETTRPLYLQYFETGNRIEFEKAYFGKREHLTVFGLLCSIQDISETKYVERLLLVIKSILEESTWVLPAHGSLEHIEGRASSIDLFAGETAGSLGEILYYIKENPIIKEKFLGEYDNMLRTFLALVQERILIPFLSKYPYDWWENGHMNWTAVCAGNIGICAYYVRLLGDILEDGEYNTIMDRVTEAMICYLDGMTKDGACTEGTGYYKYGMEYFLGFYEILIETGRNELLYRIGDFSKAAMFLQRVYLGNGKSVNFSDCSIESKSKMGILSFLCSLYENVRAARDFFTDDVLKLDLDKMEILGGDECHRWLGGSRDYLWVEKYGIHLKKEESQSVTAFPHIMWYIKKWRDGTAFYIKGGHNDESHNHNDVGSFAYIVEGEEILCELGVGEYTRDYFGPKRYEILCTGSKGHNVPIIDGKYENTGREAGASDFKCDDNSVEIAYGNAYGLKGDCVKRHIDINQDGGFVIRDSFRDINKITEVFVSKIKPKITENIVAIKGKSTVIEMVYESGNMPYIEEVSHINHDGTEMKVYLIKADYINNQTVIIIEVNCVNV